MQRALLDGQLNTLVYQRTGPMPINLYRGSARAPANINKYKAQSALQLCPWSQIQVHFMLTSFVS
jgi:hypothetical protein